MLINGHNYRVYSITPNVQLQYKLVEKDNGTSVTIDRGVNSDIYESSFTIMGATDTIVQLFESIHRYDHITVGNYNIDEALFGDNIDLTYLNRCTIMELGELKQRTISSSELTLTVRASTNQLLFIGTTELPSMSCIATGYYSKTTLGQTLVDSYTGNMTITDRLKDIYECELTATLTLADAIKLQNWYRTQRGKVFTMEQSNWGVDKPFRQVDNGFLKPIELGTYPYNARMLSLSIVPLGSTHRQVTMKLRKEGV